MKSNDNTIGGQWLPRLLTWGGVILMLVGGIVAYPTLQNYLVPPDAQSLEFAITLTPPRVVGISPPTVVVPTPPPLILPETEIVTQESPATPEPQVEATAILEATVEAITEATAEATLAPTVPPTPVPTLDPASLIPSRVVIPAISLDAPIVEVGWETMEVDGDLVGLWVVPNSFAAGWHKISAPPGHVGNTVLNGHHNIHGEVFRDLVDLEPGDEIVIYAGETEHYYGVTERHLLEEKGQPVEVRMQNAQWIMPTEDERLTLVTCWPYTNNTHRLVIVALPTQPPVLPVE